MFPPLIRSPVSRAKDENVVNPPQIPTFRNRTALGFSALFFSASAAIIPITKEPAILIRNVFTGKAPPSFRGISPIRYLQTAPINPPAPTTIQSIIITPSFNNFFHHIVYQQETAPFHLLFQHDPVSPLQKKGLCRDRGVSRDLLCRNRSLQFIADRGCDALTLMILMYVQPVQVSCAVYISESEEPFPEVLLFLFRFFRHDRKMLPKR